MRASSDDPKDKVKAESDVDGMIVQEEEEFVQAHPDSDSGALHSTPPGSSELNGDAKNEGTDSVNIPVQYSFNLKLNVLTIFDGTSNFLSLTGHRSLVPSSTLCCYSKLSSF